MKTIAVISCVLALSLIAECELSGVHHKGHHETHEKKHPDHHEKKHHEHDEKKHHHPSSSSSSESKSHSQSHSHSHSSEEHHKRPNRECSVKTSYWLDHIKEKRVCRDTATSDTASCGNCCVSGYLDEHGSHAETTGVIGFLAVNPKDNTHKQCVCCFPTTTRKHSGSHSASTSGSNEKLSGRCHFKRLSHSDMVAYAASYDSQPDDFNFESLGEISYLHTDAGGLVVECQCYNKINNSFCALEFDNDISTFTATPHNSTAFNVNSGPDGSFQIVSSKSIPITCGQNGLFIVNGTALSHITCYSATFSKNNCFLPPTGDSANCTTAL